MGAWSLLGLVLDGGVGERHGEGAGGKSTKGSGEGLTRMARSVVQYWYYWNTRLLIISERLRQRQQHEISNTVQAKFRVYPTVRT